MDDNAMIYCMKMIEHQRLEIQRLNAMFAEQRELVCKSLMMIHPQNIVNRPLDMKKTMTKTKHTRAKPPNLPELALLCQRQQGDLNTSTWLHGLKTGMYDDMESLLANHIGHTPSSGPFDLPISPLETQLADAASEASEASTSSQASQASEASKR
jgi:hypothetical protein